MAPRASAKDAAEAGVDGLITVDLPPEEDEVLRVPASAHGTRHRALSPRRPLMTCVSIRSSKAPADFFIMFRSPASPAPRDFAAGEVETRRHARESAKRLPCAVGFGIKTPEQAAAIARFADGAVVGSAIVTRIAEGHANGAPRADFGEGCA